MKRLFVFCMMAIVVGVVQAQTTRHERSEFSFKNTKVKNADGEISHVKMGAYVSNQLVKEYTFELPAPVPEDMADLIGTVSEEDLNFDGYPDVNVYLGYMGGFANNTWHEALLWDQLQRCFVEAEDFSGIGEPMCDSEKQYISTVLSAGPDHRVSSYYRWKGNKLVKYFENTWAIEDDEYVNFDGLLNYPCHRFDAMLDGRIPVNIVFQRTDDDVVAGYIFYPKAKNPAPIMIAGIVTQYEGTDYYHMYEYQSDGIISGEIAIEYKMEDEWKEVMSGTWKNPKTQKELVMNNLTYSREMPKWFTQSLLTPEDPGNIGKEYSFQKWDQNYQSMMGGHITFRAAGKNKVHFECGNVRHNIAEGGSETGRPAELKGNRFEYRDVNECGYGFSATFYPRFVVLNTITDNESLECFGMGAAFDGIYIKVKQ